MKGDNHDLTVMEAVNILSKMSEIDLENFSKQGKPPIKEVIDWEDSREALQDELPYREAFRVLHCYLQNMVRKDRNFLGDQKAMRGVQGIMILAQEAAIKMDQYAKLYPDKHKPISSLKEYTDLQKYYRQYILKQMRVGPEVAEEWEESLGDVATTLEDTRKSLSDLEVVRKDERYELFFIKSESGKRYFNSGLLRHIRLVGNFDEFVGKIEGDDPLLQLQEILDHEIHEGAKQILQSVAICIDEFYREAKIIQDKPLVWNMNKALVALRMAANAKNLIENESFKSCMEYYSDFHRFLRLSMEAPGYVKRISGEITEDRFGHVMLRMVHTLCCNLFMRKESKREGVKLIHTIIKKGNELRGPRQKNRADDKAFQCWEDLKDNDESIRFLLSHYPNGPLLQILDLFRKEGELEGFDPFLQGNFPAQLLTLENDQIHLSVFRAACPTRQKYIGKAEIVEEFHGFLRFYKYDLKSDKHLIVNLQNRTSWEEFARCKALEESTIRAEICDQFALLGLSKGTPFYNQEGEYEALEDAPLFIEQFSEQVLSVAECGYFLPIKLKMRQCEDFIRDGMKVCHELFFDGKTHLSHKERLNFIEIFYLMFTYRIIDLLDINSVSFSCKDGIDVGMAQGALFYTFTQLVSHPKGWSNEDVEQLLRMLYSPALFIRERAILKEPFKRVVMAMEAVHYTCHTKGKKVEVRLNELYDRVKFPLKVTGG